MRLIPSLAAFCLALPAFADNAIDRTRPDAPELAAFGSQKIGVQTLQFQRKDVVDVVNMTATDAPSYDRDITVEVWYPASDVASPGTEYQTVLRDGQTDIILTGRAMRDAPPADQGPYPLVILSHGYPGNRFLMSHLGENLASKGYVVASIDHPDSTYSDQGAFGSTLYHRPLDQAFVLDAMAGDAHPLAKITDGSNTALVGYSMGGYGGLIFAGGGLDEAPLALPYAPPQDLLATHLANSETHQSLTDPRLKAVIAIGPWGRNRDFWSQTGLSGITIPLMVIAGSVDDISEYPAIRRIFDETTGTTRHLLTFEGGNHNAAAPIPAPVESWSPVETLDFIPFEHYADPVWDTLRMNNITQHFVTAFVDLHLKGVEDRAAYFDLTAQAEDGVWSVADDGTQKDDHNYWKGFPNRTAKALRFETKTP